MDLVVINIKVKRNSGTLDNVHFCRVPRDLKTEFIRKLWAFEDFSMDKNITVDMDYVSELKTNIREKY